MEDYMDEVWRSHPRGIHNHYLVMDEENNRYVCLLCGKAFGKEEAPKDATYYAIEV